MTNSKLMSPQEYEESINKEAKRLAKKLKIPFSSTGKTVTEKYYFIQGVKEAGK